MNGFLSQKFNNLIKSEQYDDAHEIIKQAVGLGYPPELINSWKDRLHFQEDSYRHPLDYSPELIRHNIDHKFQAGFDLRQCFQSNIEDYFEKNRILTISIAEIVELVFENLDQKVGKILVPDLTSHEPLSNLISYSVDQYIVDCPDVIKAVKDGALPSLIDHFLRFGFFEIINGQRSSSICLAHDRKCYLGKILYIVDDYYQLNDKEIFELHSIQLKMFSADILSVSDFCVYTSSGSCLNAEKYFFQNISEVHNLCIMLDGKKITNLATKWISDIKLNDKTAIFGHASNDGIFHPSPELSPVNLLVADVTNGCIIVNSIEVLSILRELNTYKTAYGFFHGLVFKLHCSGVNFILKSEVLSKSRKNISDFSTRGECDMYWSPFYWHIDNTNKNKVLLSSIRHDLIATWSKYLSTKSLPINSAQSFNIEVDREKCVLTIDPLISNKIAIVIPFKDKIRLLENCIESLASKREEIEFTIYAVNNDSCEVDTFSKLSMLEKKYSDQFVIINSPGEFNYSKINNDAVKHVKDYILFLNNDILFETDWTLTTLLNTHLLHNAIITGARLVYPSGNIQHNGLATTNQKHIAVISPFRGLKSVSNNHASLVDSLLHPWDRSHECSAVTAACMLIKKSDFEALGGFDEQLEISYNDVDLCLRAKEHYPSRAVICCNESTIIHLESESRGLDVDRMKNIRLAKERYSLVNKYHDIFNRPDKLIGIDIASDNIFQAAKRNLDLQYKAVESSVHSISLEKIYCRQLFDESKNKFACIFVHFDKDSIISEDCVHHIRKLTEYCDVYFVSSSEKLASKTEEIDKLMSLCKQILIRKNSGYDFGCWSHVIRDNYEDLCGYQGVLLCNDSNWGPMNDFSDAFKKIKKYSSYADFFGLTSSITPSWHLQSFFVLYSQRVFCSSYFKQHWFNIAVMRSKYEIVLNYEVNWSGRLKRLGFKGMSLYGDSSSLAENRTHMHWDILLKNNYPYLKKELIRDNPLMIDLIQLPDLISIYKENWTYHILEYLKRNGKEDSDIFSILSKS